MGRPSQAEQFWTERKVSWYRRALDRSDYAATVLRVLEPVLADCETALDVGAGCGALSLPLAERLRHVTALEPAPAMAKALRQGARAGGLDNLDALEGAWGDLPVEPHDLVLCAHVGHLLRPAAAFLREVSAVARRWVALIRDATTDQDKFYFRELYPLLLKRSYGPGCDHEETVEGLAQLGRQPRVTVVEYHSDQPFRDLEDACDFWEEYLDVRGFEVRTFLRSFLAERLVPDGTGWIAPYRKRAAIIWWPTATETS